MHPRQQHDRQISSSDSCRFHIANLARAAWKSSGSTIAGKAPTAYLRDPDGHKLVGVAR
jgi:hypothetical protein